MPDEASRSGAGAARQPELDRVIDRRGSHSLKWEFVVRDRQAQAWDRTDPALGDAQVLPMWVADMDFRVAEPIIEALHARVEHGLFGYAAPDDAYRQAILDWLWRRQGWRARAEWMVATPGVVPALSLIVRQFTAPGEAVLIQRPVYHPFTHAVTGNGREVVSSALRLQGGQYRMDFEDLERRAADPRVRLALLCSPHNPVGRVWSAHELARFGAICQRHGVLVVADEIHGDLILPGHRFASYGGLDAALRDNAIICTAPSKTFNLAGLHSSTLFIADQTLRARALGELRSTGLGGLDPFSIVATEAAYRHGEAWLDAAIAYLDGNLDLLAARLTAIPGVELIRPEGTYLAWLDCRGLGLAPAALAALFGDAARLYVVEGGVFGVEGEGFVRMNVACPRGLLERACGRLEQAVAALRD